MAFEAHGADDSMCVIAHNKKIHVGGEIRVVGLSRIFNRQMRRNEQRTNFSRISRAGDIDRM